MSEVAKPELVPSFPGRGVRVSSESGNRVGGIAIAVNGAKIEVFPELEAAMHGAHTSALLPLPTEMTAAQAAEFLDVSRPLITRLLSRGELPCRIVGQHHHIPTEALLEYRVKIFQAAQTAADEMARLSQEAGLDEPEHSGKAS